MVAHSDWWSAILRKDWKPLSKKDTKNDQEDWKEVNQEIGTASLQDKDCKRFSIMQAFSKK